MEINEKLSCFWRVLPPEATRSSLDAALVSTLGSVRGSAVSNPRTPAVGIVAVGHSSWASGGEKTRQRERVCEREMKQTGTVKLELINKLTWRKRPRFALRREGGSSPDSSVEWYNGRVARSPYLKPGSWFMSLCACVKCMCTVIMSPKVTPSCWDVTCNTVAVRGWSLW